jgi:hypothetical protein
LNFIEHWGAIIGFMLSDAAESVFFQTFFGAAAGAWAAFAFQGQREKRQNIELKISLINFSMVSLLANTETLIGYKKSIVLPMLECVDEINRNEEFRKFLDTGALPDARRVGVLNLNALVNFHGDPTFLDLPNLEKLSVMAGKYPNLIRLGYKVNKSIHNFQVNTAAYNETTKKISDEPSGANPQYISFLVSLAGNISKDIDEALFFIGRMEKVFNQICDETLPRKRKGITKYKIDEKFKDLLPSDDLVSGF